MNWPITLHPEKKILTTQTINSMKYTIPFLLLFSLGSCTETIYEEVIKTVRKDSLIRDTVPGKIVYIDRVRIDSFPYPVFIKDSAALAKCDPAKIDTVYLPGNPYPVYVYDSVHVVQHHYTDIMYIPLGWSTTAYREYQESAEEFYRRTVEYAWDVPGGDVLIEYWIHEEAPPASRSSYSFMYFDQLVIKIKDTLTPDQAYSAVMRELGRWQLGKKYTQDPDDFMNPDFEWDRCKLSSSEQVKKPFLDKLFAK